jgi:hypothetical protein
MDPSTQRQSPREWNERIQPGQHGMLPRAIQHPQHGGTRARCKATGALHAFLMGGADGSHCRAGTRSSIQLACGGSWTGTLAQGRLAAAWF